MICVRDNIIVDLRHHKKLYKRPLDRRNWYLNISTPLSGLIYHIKDQLKYGKENRI